MLQSASPSPWPRQSFKSVTIHQSYFSLDTNRNIEASPFHLILTYLGIFSLTLESSSTVSLGIVFFFFFFTAFSADFFLCSLVSMGFRPVL